MSFSDRAHVDTDRLNLICDQIGPSQGETVICAAMEDMAALLHAAHDAWTRCDLDMLRLTATQISGVAERIGLTTLSRVAGDVAGLCKAVDDAGLAATVARMTRLGEGSLIAIWEAQDISV